MKGPWPGHAGAFCVFPARRDLGGDDTLAVTSDGVVTWEEVLGPHCLGLTLALPFVAVQPSASPRTMPGALRPAGGPMRQGCCHCRSWRPAFLTS